MVNLKTANLNQVAEELGLINSTSPTQRRNGTVSYIDPVTSTTAVTIMYTVHSNGYVRRNFRYSKNNKFNTCYQLNRTRKNYNTIEINGKHIHLQSTERILATPLEQVAILYLSTINYRKNK